MKNFPHQISKLERFAGGLKAFVELADSGADLTDDGVAGDALARAGVYGFRDAGDPINIEELLAEEHLKSSSSQGTRTMARELRRTFRHLGFLVDTSTGLQPASAARRVIELEHAPLSPEARAVWSASFRALELTDETGTSHPYEVMLRLAGERPGMDTGLLGLALEANNDSDSEFRRLLDLVDQDTQEPAWDRIGVSVHQSHNSVKILPAVARQLGDIEVYGTGAHLTLPDPTAPREERRRTSTASVRARRRRYDRSRSRGLRPRFSGTSLRTYDPDLVAGRYADHETCLEAFDALLPDELTRWEGDYDLLCEADPALLLIEVKTIRMDANHQARLGLAQLLYYEYFPVSAEWDDRRVHRILVVDREIDDELCNFLDSHSVGVVWRASDESWGGTERAKTHLADVGVTI